jgi:hypothetical protein
MKRSTTKLTGTILLGAAVSLTGACGSSEPGEGSGDAFLTIVGDRNVYLESGDQAELQVRYHDRGGEALAGVISFSIDGASGLAQLSGNSATTNSDGVASVTLQAVNDDQDSIFVEATAPGAGSVTWNVTLAQAAAPVDPNGVYRVDSSLDLVSGLEEGTVKSIVDNVIAFVESPAAFLADLLLEQCGSTCENLNRSVVIAAFEVALNQFAPDLVNDFLEHGSNFAGLIQNFGVVSELTIDGSSGEHEMTGVRLTYGSDVHSFTMGQLNLDNVEAANISVTLSNNDRQVDLGEHGLPFSYGALIKLALEQVIIPLIDSSANNLQGFLANLIDCRVVADAIVDPENDLHSVVEAACIAARSFGAQYLVGLLDDIDGVGLEFVLSGSAEPVSTNGDDRANVLRNGRWEGTLQYPGSVMVTLDPSDNRFTAERTD